MQTLEEKKAYKKQWYLANRELTLERSRQWKLNNEESRAEYAKDYAKKKKPWATEKYKKYRKEYDAKNKEKRNLQVKERRRADIAFNLVYCLRSRLNSAVKNGSKRGKTLDYLGCTIEDFRAHIESKFTTGMTWANRTQWHLDHIVPLTAFDLTKESEIHKAMHFSNIQPLWAFDNQSKGNKMLL